MPGPFLRLFLIVSAAIVPLIGVLAGGWSLQEIVVLYWAENVIIGGFQVVRMLTASPADAGPVFHVGKMGLAAFFTVHYGIFCLVHGIFVITLTSGGFGHAGGGPGNPVAAMNGFPGPFWFALGLLAANHLWELIENWFVNGRWRSAAPGELMVEPYKHIVVLHVAIIFGAFLSIALGSAIGILVLIVLGKLLLDLRGAKRQGDDGFLRKLRSRGRTS